MIHSHIDRDTQTQTDIHTVTQKYDILDIPPVQTVFFKRNRNLLT